MIRSKSKTHYFFSSMRYTVILPFILSLFLACQSKQEGVHRNLNLNSEISIESPQAISLLGKPLMSPEPSSKLLERFHKRKKSYEEDPSNIENVIWFGRFTAYIGDYKEAIRIYSEGMEHWPDDPRLYRHRGHRYISTRQFDLAIADFKKAETLIAGTPNEVEPDGMPNAQNIPVSTLHGNIYYHLGLSYFLTNDMPMALQSFNKCLDTSVRPDNVVSASHWLYMIHKRMNHDDNAERILSEISESMEIIENHSYHKLCLFYKGVLAENELLDPNDSGSANDAIKYGLANWYFVNGQKEKAISMMKELTEASNWASFGYIAAEADLSRL